MSSAAANRFQRIYLIFSNEDSGFEYGKKPSGYLKLEIRGGKGRLDAVLHNLRDGSGRFVYALYLLRASADTVEYIRAGELTHMSGRHVLEWSFDPDHLSGGSFAASEFDTAVILAEYGDRAGSGIRCPLAAYRDRRTEWRNGFGRMLRTEGMPVQNDIKAAAKDTLKDAPVSNAEVQTRTHAANVPQSPAYNIAEPEILTEPETQPHGENEPQVTASPVQEIHIPFAVQPEPGVFEGTESKQCISEEAEPSRSIAPAEAEQSQPSAQDEAEPTRLSIRTEAEPSRSIAPAETEPSRPFAQAEAGLSQPCKPEEDRPAGPCTMTEAETRPYTLGSEAQEAVKTDKKYPESLKGINTECVYLNGNLCDAFVAGRSNCDPCGSCRINRGGTPVEARPAGDLEQLQKQLDESFETSDPFRSRRSDYKWWRVTNPVNLNNILYQNNIRSPLLFNPAVMMAHYKYRHLIIGIFSHKNGRKYVVCGIPGMHMVDMKPFGEMNTWVQAEGSRLRYGAFGYWLVYIDPDNGKIMYPK